MKAQELVKHLNELELRCVTGNFVNYDFPELSLTCRSHPLFKAFDAIVKNVLCYEYEQVLGANLSDYLLEMPLAWDFTEEIRWSFVKCDSAEDENLTRYVRELILLFIGTSALQVFTKINACGPGIGELKSFQLCTSLLPEDKFSESDCSNFLSKNGEFPAITFQPRLLCLAGLFLSGNLNEVLSITSCWWRMRYIVVHQHILPDRISSMHDELSSLFDKIVHMKWLEDQTNLLSKVMFYIESAQIRLYYHEVIAAQKLIDTASHFIGLGVELSGGYGKRTQFQQKAVAQLFVKLQRDTKLSSHPVTLDRNVDFPVDLNLGDDTLLNRVSFINPDESCVESLLPEEQIVLLGYCCLAGHRESYDVLDQEELMSFINCLLEQPKIWSIYLKALIMRCKAEKKSSRRVERSLMQLEGVIDAIRKEEPHLRYRMPLLFCVAFPTIQILEKELADTWISVGGIKSALTIYERLGFWKDIVVCYLQLGRTACAEALVREQLVKKETPELLCLLGDVTDNLTLYHKAFELSGNANARSQRSLGYYYYKRKNYVEAVKYFSKSLDINHLQPEVWFSLGYSAFQCEDYTTAARAYRQVVTLDQDNFQAWNNLSSAYIRLQQKERAWRSLQEAIKCNYEDWHVWENLLLVSTDIGAFEDVMRSWHRLLDIKGKFKDDQVLNILVRAINENLSDFGGQPSSRLRKRALKLLGRISATICNDWDIWECYSRLQCPDTESETDKEVVEKALSYQQKAIRCSMHVQLWDDLNVCQKGLNSAIRLAKLFALSIQISNAVSCNQQKTMCRLSLKPVLLRLEQRLKSNEDPTKDDKEETFQQLEKSLEMLKTMFRKIQNL